MANEDAMQMIYVGELEFNSFYLEGHQRPGRGERPSLCYMLSLWQGPNYHPSPPYRQQTWEILLYARQLRAGPQGGPDNSRPPVTKEKKNLKE